jgi:serine/threonine protein kinase
VVLYGMLNNKFPFKFKDLRRMLQTQLNRIWKYREDREEMLSREVRDLISRIFEPDEPRRPTMDDVMRHPWCASAGTDGPTKSFSLNKSVDSRSD